MLHHLMSSRFIYAHESGVENVRPVTLARTNDPFSHLRNLEPWSGHFWLSWSFSRLWCFWGEGLYGNYPCHCDGGGRSPSHWFQNFSLKIGLSCSLALGCSQSSVQLCLRQCRPESYNPRASTLAFFIEPVMVNFQGRSFEDSQGLESQKSGQEQRRTGDLKAVTLAPLIMPILVQGNRESCVGVMQNDGQKRGITPRKILSRMGTMMRSYTGAQKITLRVSKRESDAKGSGPRGAWSLNQTRAEAYSRIVADGDVNIPCCIDVYEQEP
ncbi:hypothetical protein VNO77_19351 [Canavalia gladiata]|uniref:Uncharacterized protein n=1 Tax=Canavalia gladiata TaxID=3824 RepID=A0AAN9QLA7_CANGL